MFLSQEHRHNAFMVLSLILCKRKHGYRHGDRKKSCIDTSTVAQREHHEKRTGSIYRFVVKPPMVTTRIRFPLQPTFLQSTPHTHPDQPLHPYSVPLFQSTSPLHQKKQLLMSSRCYLPPLQHLLGFHPASSTPSL